MVHLKTSVDNILIDIIVSDEIARMKKRVDNA